MNNPGVQDLTLSAGGPPLIPDCKNQCANRAVFVLNTFKYKKQILGVCTAFSQPSKGAFEQLLAAIIINLHILTSFYVILNGQEIANYYFSCVVPPFRALPAPFGRSYSTFLV